MNLTRTTAPRQSPDPGDEPLSAFARYVAAIEGRNLKAMLREQRRLRALGYSIAYTGPRSRGLR